ncbi:NADPH oxidase organizer 1-like [Denticeps clupeoides]|uniref:SH3 domain-containing protein n=1 Tax=Denticeps clupeoides TaxID=299321 RepID=A0AAY4B997_9TELE|nr:NADPH oxidase organizer 1 [Denticeps clupeoides]
MQEARRRVPVSIRLVGVTYAQSGQMFMTSVLWSDGAEMMVYRSARDFEQLHKRLKRSCRRDRRGALPKFRGRKVRGRPRSGEPARSVLRLRALEEYGRELVSCGPAVTHSQEFLLFCQPQEQDLQADFAKNSVVILPAEDVAGSEAAGAGVTRPFVTETYRCVAPYETKDTKNKAFRVAMDETVDVLIKDKAGWWLVENEAKCLAWFPAPYLERCDVGEEEEPEPLKEAESYCATKGYNAKSEDELSLSIGQVVEVLRKPDDGWWLIRYRGTEGYVPSMFLQPYIHPRIQFSSTSSHSSNQLQTPSAGLLGRSHSSSHLSSDTGFLKPRDAAQDRMCRSLEVLHPGSGVHKGTEEGPPSIRVEAWDRDLTNCHDDSSSDDDETLSFSSNRSLSNLSISSVDNFTRPGYSPPPPDSTRLAPCLQRTLSISDPNLSKSRASPRVPPRPEPQEILKRCSTITVKNHLTAAAGSATPSYQQWRSEDMSPCRD